MLAALEDRMRPLGETTNLGLAPSLHSHAQPRSAARRNDEHLLNEAIAAFMAFLSRSTGIAPIAPLHDQLRRILRVEDARSLLPFWLHRAMGGSRATQPVIARVAAVTWVLQSTTHGLASSPTPHAASLLIFAALEFLGDSQLSMLAINAVTRSHIGHQLELGFADPLVAAELLSATHEERASRWMLCTRGTTSQLMSLSLSLRGAAHVLGLALTVTTALANAIADYGCGRQMLDDAASARDSTDERALSLALRNWACVALFATLEPSELAIVRVLYDTPALTQYLRQHRDFDSAIARASEHGAAYVDRGETALIALTDGRERDYLSALLAETGNQNQ